MAKSKLIDVYMAGYFDGEGCVGVYHRVDHGERRYWRVTATVRSTYKKIVFDLQEAYGGWSGPAQRGPLSKQDQWQWQINGNKSTLPFLRRVLPYLREKRPQAKAAIAFIGGKLSGPAANRILTRLKHRNAALRRKI